MSGSGLAAVFFPTRCGICGLLDDSSICDTCRSDFRQVFRNQRLDVDRFEILFHYTGRAGQAVRRLKYSRSTSLASAMADLLAETYQRVYEGEIDAIVPVPLHWSRRFYRGFNQSDLLCSALPAELVRPELLSRVRATRSQASLTPAQRLVTLDGAFRASRDVSGQSVLLIDDVVTSGTTAAECAKALREAGAREVALLAFAGSP